MVVLLEFIWAQEEAQNMGAWSFVEPHFRRKLGIEVSQMMPTMLNKFIVNAHSWCTRVEECLLYQQLE